MTLIINYCYRIYPDASQEETMLHWLEISRKVYNYALREIKDWVNSRKCSLDYCSLEREYIVPADKPFPTYYVQQNELPKAKKKFPLLGEALLKFCKLLFVDCMMLGIIFSRGGLAFLASRSLDKSSPCCFLNSKPILLRDGR
jgi:hypothetical protein